MSIVRSLVLLTLLFLLAGSLDILPERNVAAVSQSGACPEKLLCVVFLDVGQGDAIFIQSPTKTQMLIDGGRGNVVLRPLADVMGFFDKTIDYVLITHPDSDHVGGLVSIFDRYEISHVLRTEKESETAVWNAVEERFEGEIHFARSGQIYDLGGGVVLTILSPSGDASDLESNDSSIVARLVYGENEFLFMGDVSVAVERELLEEDIQSDVLKVGHHGSKTSTAQEFVEVVRPIYSIISAGKDNWYGHPHEEVLEKLASSIIKNTAEEGSIFMVSDGKSIWFK